MPHKCLENKFNQIRVTWISLMSFPVEDTSTVRGDYDWVSPAKFGDQKLCRSCELQEIGWFDFNGDRLCSSHVRVLILNTLRSWTVWKFGVGRAVRDVCMEMCVYVCEGVWLCVWSFSKLSNGLWIQISVVLHRQQNSQTFLLAINSITTWTINA